MVVLSEYSEALLKDSKVYLESGESFLEVLRESTLH